MHDVATDGVLLWTLSGSGGGGAQTSIAPVRGQEALCEPRLFVAAPGSHLYVAVVRTAYYLTLWTVRGIGGPPNCCWQHPSSCKAARVLRISHTGTWDFVVAFRTLLCRYLACLDADVPRISYSGPEPDALSSCSQGPSNQEDLGFDRIRYRNTRQCNRGRTAY